MQSVISVKSIFICEFLSGAEYQMPFGFTSEQVTSLEDWKGG